MLFTLLKVRRRLRESGFIGINKRNLDFIARYNSRRSYPLVDDKLTTKQLCLDNGIAVPQLYSKISTQRAITRLHTVLSQHQQIVLKPARGSGGNGILIIDGMVGDFYRKPSGKLVSLGAIKHHVSNILSGMYSLGGMTDEAFIEYMVKPSSIFVDYAYQGVPDIRVIVFRGVPVAAMLRLPTRESDGKANLHQGALGVGIEMRQGVTTLAVHKNQLCEYHPDTKRSIQGMQLPDWQAILDLSMRCADVVKMGYLGVDIVLDKDQGPLVLELNARPGLNVQLANGAGLDTALKQITKLKEIPEDHQERLNLLMLNDQLTFGGQSLFGDK